MLHVSTFRGFGARVGKPVFPPTMLKDSIDFWPPAQEAVLPNFVVLWKEVWLRSRQKIVLHPLKIEFPENSHPTACLSLCLQSNSENCEEPV